MSEQAHEIASYTKEKKSTLDYLLLVGGWFVSFFSLVIIVLISYWAIKIPEKSVNNLPIINALKGDISCLLYTSPSPRDRPLSRMPSSA